jgi:two-component sensor histidine kinase
VAAETNVIAVLCQEHSDLSDEEIGTIEQMALSLENIADLLSADVFIDCRTRDSDVAVVVAQARPSAAESLYAGMVVGQFAYRDKEPAVIRTLNVGMPTMDMRGVTQEDRNVRQKVTPIKNDNGEVIAALIAETDVTEKIRAEKKMSALTQSTGQLVERGFSQTSDQVLPDYVTDGVVIFDCRGNCTYVNPVAEKIYRKLGYQERLEGLRFSNLAFHGVTFEDIIAKNELILNDFEVGRFSFHIRYTHIRAPYIKVQSGTRSGVVMLINDVTEVRNKEKELILKAVAISEIHHRVKNNLQTIASLLKLQARRIDDPVAKTAFNESISQVLSIAATHEALAGEGRDHVDLKAILETIRGNFQTHGMLVNKQVEIVVRGDNIFCNSDIATSTALVVNEVVQNCLKYAFIGRKAGHIDIEIFQGERYANIAIIDDGVGYDLKQGESESLGLMIVRRIVAEKLRGILKTESNNNGTKVMFDFPLVTEHSESM